MPFESRALRLLVAATAVACPLFLAGLYVDSLWVRLPAKPWPHLALIAWLMTGAASRYGRRILVAVALCMVADILLEFRQTLFTYGILVFLAAQLTLASAFTLRCRELRAASALPFVLWLGIAFAILAPGLGSMRPAVAAYMTAIGLMMWRAAACVAAGVGDGVDDADATALIRGGDPEGRAAILALAGAVVFGVSDSFIAFDRFQAPIAGARYVIIVTYWLALALIAASAVRVQRYRAGY